jgi:hypothetical protein
LTAALSCSSSEAGPVVAAGTGARGNDACDGGAFAKTGFSPEYQHRSRFGPYVHFGQAFGVSFRTSSAVAKQLAASAIDKDRRVATNAGMTVFAPTQRRRSRPSRPHLEQVICITHSFYWPAGKQRLTGIPEHIFTVCAKTMAHREA